jgi:DNA-binding transcriptional MerR regulator
MRDLDIADVARLSGVPASALRFYEEKGLIASIGRRGLKRLFDPSILERLTLIALGRAAGFTLGEIAAMFAADGRPRIDRRKLAAKADALDRTIRDMTALRNGLRHAAACPAPSHLECPSFRRLLRAAGAGIIRAPETPARKTKRRAGK